MTGMVGVCVFNWRVFRPREAWACWLTAGVTCAFAAVLALQSVTPGVRVAALHNEGLGLHAFMALLAAPTAWAAFESFRYHRLLTRRSKLGLADPVVADRLRLWGLGMLVACVISILTQIFALFGIDAAVSPAGALMIAPLGLVAASSVWLAFLPPAAYTRRVLARAATGGVSR
jgi:hypothetical protein